MPHNNNKNNSFHAGGGRKKNKRGGGGRKKRTDTSIKQQPAEQEPTDSDNSEVVATIDDSLKGVLGHREPQVDKDNEHLNQAYADKCDNATAAVPKLENCTTSETIAVPPTDFENDEDVHSHCTEKGDDNNNYYDDDGKSARSVEELHSHDNCVAGVEEHQDPVQISSSQSEIELSEVIADVTTAPSPDSDCESAFPVPILEIPTNAAAEPGLHEKIIASSVSGPSEVNRWSIDSVLYSDQNNTSADDKTIERLNDTVHEASTIAPTDTGSEGGCGSIELLKPINYGRTGLQIEEHQVIENSSSIDSSNLPQLMGPEVGSDNCYASSSLSKSSSFSSNSSANTLSTIIFTGQPSESLLREEDNFCQLPTEMDCEPKSLRELALAYLTSLPFGLSIIEELASVSERLKDLVLQSGTMDHIASTMQTMPPPIPPRRKAPVPAPSEVKEIKLDRILASPQEQHNENNSRLLSIIRDSSGVVASPTNDITSGSKHCNQQSHALESTNHRGAGIIRPYHGGGGNQLNHLKSNTMPFASDATTERSADPHGGQMVPQVARDNGFESKMKEELFINGDQGDETNFKNTSTQDEVTNNYCKSVDSHPLKDQIRDTSTVVAVGTPSYSFATTSENLHQNRVIRPLSKEDQFSRGQVSAGTTFKVPTVYEEEELCEASNTTNKEEELVHHRLKQLSDMHKKRSSYIEAASAGQSVKTLNAADQNVVLPTRRRSSLPYELHERQLLYLAELEKKIDQQQNQFFRPNFSVLPGSSSAMQEHLSEAEAFRKQMHEEWRARIAEREERRFSKVIKMTPIIPEEILPTGQKSHMFESSMEDEFLKRVQQRRQKLHLPADSDWDSGAESNPKECAQPPKVFNIPITMIDGEKTVTDVQKLPKHLQEFAESYVKCPSPAVDGGDEVRDGPLIATSQAQATCGKWSPNGEDTWREDLQGQKRSGSVQLESQPQVPVWTPRSAQSSPVASRKQYRPVQFHSPQMERKFTNLNGGGGDSSIPPWEQPGFDKLPPPVQHHTSYQDGSNNKSSVRRLAQSFSAPKLAGVVDGHSESYSKHSLNYVCPPTRSLFEDAHPSRPPCSEGRGDKNTQIREQLAPISDYDQGREMNANIPKPVQSQIMTREEAAPISLRSEAKDHNQSNWYKQVYNTIHKPHGDDGFLTVRYKTRRGGGACHKANGYMSEPEHGYESDYASVDAYSGITPQKPPGSYKMSPGKIENYSPGQYAEPEKQRPVKPIRQCYAQGNLSRALKEQGYESDNSLVARKKNQIVSTPSPEYQKQAYLQVQAGGEPPLQGFRKQLPSRPKELSPEPASPVSFDIFDLVSPPAAHSMPSSDIICYPITNITRPLNLFCEFPPSKAFIPPTPPVRDSSISNYYFNDMLLMATDDKVSIVNHGGMAKPIGTSKDQKNLTNSSKAAYAACKSSKSVHCKRYSRAVSEPRRACPSPVAFGRSISKERTFAEEKKRLEQISPQCKKAANLSTRILKKGDYKSSEDLRKAIHRTVGLGKKPTPTPMHKSQRDYLMTYQRKGDSHKWVSMSSSASNQTTKTDSGKKHKTESKQMTRRDHVNSSTSLARTNSTFSIDSTSRSCEPIKCHFFGSRKVFKVGAFVQGKPSKNNNKEPKPVTQKIKSTPKTIKGQGKCHPVNCYLSNKRPVTTSKFKLFDRHRSVSPTRVVKTLVHTQEKIKQDDVMCHLNHLNTFRSKSQPPKMVEIMIPDEPTVIHVKPKPTVPESYHSLPRTSRQFKEIRCVREFSTSNARAKSEGPFEKMPEDVTNRWSMSTPSLNIIGRHSGMSRYRNADRFLELNQFYSQVERVGLLQRVTSQSDLRPIRKKEEVVDYELWKKIRMREKAQKELDFLVNQLKNNQKEKKFHFERDIDSIRWNEDNEPALRQKSMSVENLKDFFQEKGIIKEKSPVENIECVNREIDSYEDQLGISSKLMSTLSPEQVLRLKMQLRQIYSTETPAPISSVRLPTEGHTRSRSQECTSTKCQPILENKPFRVINAGLPRSNLTEQDKRDLTQSICSEIKLAVEQRRRHKSLDGRTPDETLAPVLDINSLQPRYVKSKIHYFEQKPLVEPGTTIYHAREPNSSSSSSEDEIVSMPPQSGQPKDQHMMAQRSHSFSDLKELFGERTSSIKCRSVSPSVRYVAQTPELHQSVLQQNECNGNDDNDSQPALRDSVSEFEQDKKKSITIAPGKSLKIDGDVSWIAHKYENTSTVMRGRCRKRRTLSGSSCHKQEEHVLMPHIDIISKTAALQNPPHRTSIVIRPLKKTGDVEKIKNFFENKHKKSLLGEMFTSEPDISKLRDVSVYLSGSWVAHQFPKKEDNFLSLRKVKTPPAKLRSLSISPSRKLGILKRCLFPYKIFDDEKLASLPFDAADQGRIFSPADTIDRAAAEKVLRKHKDRRAINEDENATMGCVPPPPPPVKATKMHALDDQYNNNKYDDDDTTRQYLDGNVNIHYKTPIRHEFKGVIPEDELAEQQAEAMRAIYEQEKRRKQWQEVEDIKNRRHTDNFTPSQKSPISVHRFDDFVGIEATKPKIAPTLAKARALYDFVSQSSRELTFSKGDIITIHRKIDANWYEGEHNAFCGLFPVDYVELISGSLMPSVSRAKKPTEGLARAKYTFVAQSGIELSLNKGELVALTRQVDENWFEGRIANRKGIIPISYCEILTPLGTKIESPLPPSVVSTRREELYIESVPERDVKTSKTEFLHVDTSSDPLLYRALFKYVPQNPDELEMFEGDTVMVLEKCDDGWFVGTSERTGCFGTFPGNYVQRI